MPNPWDRPPIPKRGDENADITFAAVGRIISQWEHVEFALSRLYTRLGDLPDDPGLMRQYGDGKIFRERMTILEKMVAKYAVGNPDQKFEAELHQLFRIVRDYSLRRNDIAHGVLWQIDRLTFSATRLKQASYIALISLLSLRYMLIGLPILADFQITHTLPLRWIG